MSNPKATKKHIHEAGGAAGACLEARWRARRSHRRQRRRPRSSDAEAPTGDTRYVLHRGGGGIDQRRVVVQRTDADARGLISRACESRSGTREHRQVSAPAPRGNAPSFFARASSRRTGRMSSLSLPGETRGAGDPATGPDTACVNRICALNEHVATHACMACAARNPPGPRRLRQWTRHCVRGRVERSPRHLAGRRVAVSECYGRKRRRVRNGRAVALEGGWVGDPCRCRRSRSR